MIEIVHKNSIYPSVGDFDITSNSPVGNPFGLKLSTYIKCVVKNKKESIEMYNVYANSILTQSDEVLINTYPWLTLSKIKSFKSYLAKIAISAKTNVRLVCICPQPCHANVIEKIIFNL